MCKNCISIHQARLWIDCVQRSELHIALVDPTTRTVKLPSLTTRDILAQPISSNLLPLHLLASDGQLSPQALEGTLGHTHKCPVQFLLVVALGGGNAGDDRLGGNGGDGDFDGLGGVQSDVAVLVVVYVDVNLAGHGGGRGGNGDLIDGAESTVPRESRTISLRVTLMFILRNRRAIGKQLSCRDNLPKVVR